jgi:YesN/AraC family two-component response regulator
MAYSLLVLDDEYYAVKGITQAIDWAGIDIDRVFEAYDASGAIEIMSRERIDVIISDIELPGKSGLELLTWISERSADIQGIFLTAHADFSYIKTAMSHRSFDYLVKPADHGELRQIVAAALAEIAAKRERAQFDELYRHIGQPGGLTAFIREFERLGDTEKKDDRLDVVQRIENYVLAHINENISRDDIARALFFNSTYLSRMFKSRTGVALGDFVCTIKMRQAKLLLDNTEYSISRVANSVGYTNFSYFAKQFKDAYGLTPSEYKRGK